MMQYGSTNAVGETARAKVEISTRSVVDKQQYDPDRNNEEMPLPSDDVEPTIGALSGQLGWLKAPARSTAIA